MTVTPNVPTNTVQVVTFAGLDANAEVIGGENYIGELPPARMALPGHIRRVYLSQTATGNDPVLKILYEATEGKYNGFSAWDNVTLNNKAAFKWKPLVAAMGIDINDLITNTRVDTSDISEAGVRVLGIGALDLTADKTVPVFFGVSYRMFDGTQQTDVAGVRPRKGMPSFVPVPGASDAQRVVSPAAKEKAEKTPGAF